jgi:hypothetical protein
MSRKALVQLTITTKDLPDPADAINAAMEQAGHQFRLVTARTYLNIDLSYNCTAIFNKIDPEGCGEQ